MITEADIMRQMVEFSETKYGPAEWAKSQDIDVDGLVTAITEFAKALLLQVRDWEGDLWKDDLEAVASTMLALFAVAFELGRQYPATPFEVGDE